MIFYLLGSSLNIVYYISKGTVMYFYNKYYERKRENRIKKLEDSLNEQKKFIYKLKYDIEEKENPNTTYGFEIIKKEEIKNYDISPTSLKK